MKPWSFLYTLKQAHGAFIRPKLKWYFGEWYKEGNLPVWRRGNTIWIARKKKRNEYKNEYSFAKLESSEWTEEGKKNHPFLSRFFKPTYELPYRLSFYLFNSDIVWKTKWSEDDFRYEYPAHITLVIFGIALSVTTYIPSTSEKDWTCTDDYWESLLTFNHFNGDLKKTNDEMGWWGKPGEENFRFRFQPRFLTNQVDRDDLVALQADMLERIKQKEGE